MSDSLKIAFVSQAGNVMKSTLVQAVAVLCEKNHVSCTVADLDKEHRTTARFIEQRKDSGITNDPITPGFNVIEVNTAKEAIAQAATDSRVYIIDAPSRANEATFYLANNVDKVILPTPPGLKDLDLAIETGCQMIDNGVEASKILFVLTRVGSAYEFNEAKAYLESVSNTIDPNYKFEVMEFPIHEQIAYRYAITNGFTILETSHATINRKAERAILTLLNKILEG